MKLCLACGKGFALNNWACESCQWTPAMIEGFPAFAPDLAVSNDGLGDDTHHLLNELQGNSFWFRQRNQLIQDMIKRYFSHAEKVLEIGCGSGFVLDGIRSALPSAELTGTEIFSYALKYASERISQPVNFLQVDGRALPFKDEFDLVGAFDVLEHIDEDNVVIENIHASLKPGGGVILTVPQHPILWSEADEHACHKRRYTRHQLRQQLQAQGFNVIVDTSFMFLLLPLMLAQRLISSRKKTYSLAKELSLPPLIDKSFDYLLRCERLAIRLGIRFPVGGSRLVVAVKR